MSYLVKWFILLFLLPPAGTSAAGQVQYSRAQDARDAARLRNLYTWGGAKDGVRVGLRHPPEPRPDRVEVVLGPADVNSQTNFMPKLYMYKRGPRFSIALRDASGKEVPKTAAGRQYAGNPGPASLNWFRVLQQPFEPLIFMGQWPEDLGYLDLDRCFDRAAAGRYEVEVKVWIFSSTNGIRRFDPVDVPAARLSINLPENPHPASHIGVILLYAVGLGSCAAGILWLYHRSRKRRLRSTSMRLPTAVTC